MSAVSIQPAITLLGAKLPPSLQTIPFPPKQIWVKGLLNKYHFKQDVLVAVVGTRHPSEYGRVMTRQIVSELARLGVVIVSGLAQGIDTEAHKTALEAGGRTIAVLGCGIERIYPRENTALAQRIVQSSGLIISEFGGQITVDRERFRARNRIITGLSRVLLVIEGTKRSGTLLSARYALEQGREVMGLPGLANTEVAQAPNLLISQGAGVLTSAADVLECLGLFKRYNTQV